MTPQLALRYSSNRGPSWVGRGFTLAVPIITRDTRNGRPTYDDAVDRYVYVIDGASRTLVEVGPQPDGAVEYRLMDDSSDTLFLRYPPTDEPCGRWEVRSRAGITSTFTAQVLAAGPGLSGSRCFAYAIREARDANSNTIRYDYGSRDLSQPSGNGGVYPLSSIWYGANERAGIPHLFRVSFNYTNAYDTPAAAQEPGARLSCAEPPGRSDYRAGGEVLNVDGTRSLLRAIAVEVVAPGTTNGAAREYRTRRTHAWQFSYNWDNGGCGHPDQIWPLLTRIDETSWGEDGTSLQAPPVTFEYSSWARTFTRFGPFPMPNTSQFGAGWPRAGFTANRPLSRSLGFLFSNDGGRTSYTNLGTSPRPPDGDPGMVEALIDVNSDSLPDLLDLGLNSRCFGNASPAISTMPGQLSAQWVPFLGPRTGFAAVPTLWPYDEEILLRWPAPLTISTVNCGLEPRRALLPNGTTADVLWHVSNMRFLDVDGDGYVDILRGNHSVTDPQWTWHRNQTGETGSVGYGIANPLLDVPWRNNVLPTNFPRPPSSAMPPTYSPNVLTDSSMQAVFLDEAHPVALIGMTSHSAESGFLADFTGDGLPDRLAVLDGTASGDNAVVVWPAVFERGWTSGRIWLKPIPGMHPLSPSATYDTDVSAWGSFDAHNIFETDRAVDLNGDGLTDLYSALPLPVRRRIPGSIETDLSLSPFGVPFWNHGRGFVRRSLRSDQPQSLRVQRETYPSVAATPGHLRTVIQLAEYNGDGLVDIVSSETSADFLRGYYRLNMGGWFGPPQPLPVLAGSVAPGDPTTFETFQADGADRVATHQVVADVTGDGRADVVRVAHGDNAGSEQFYVYTDAVDVPPGVMVAMRNGRGATTTFQYATLASVRGASRGAPAPAWVVTSVRTDAGDGGGPRETRFTYGDAVFGRSPETFADRRTPITYHGSLRGFAAVTVTPPAGPAVRSTFAFDRPGALGATQYRDGMLVRREYLDVRPGLERVLRVDELEYDERLLNGRPSDGSRPGERYFRHRLTSQRSREFVTAGMSIDRTVRYEFDGDEVQPARVIEQGDASDPTLARTTALAYATPSSASDRRRPLKAVQFRAGVGTAGTLLNETRYGYDGAEAGTGTFSRGWLTSVATVVSETGATRTTRLEYDPGSETGQPTRIISPGAVWNTSGAVQRICWDRYRLYPVASQDAAGLVGRSVVSYVTGQTLEQSGPVGYSTSTPIVCEPVATTVSWTPRNMLVPLVPPTTTTTNPPPVRAVPPLPPGTTTRAESIPANPPGPPGTPESDDQLVMPHERPITTTSIGEATGELALTPTRGSHYVPPASVMLGAEPGPRPTNVALPTTRMEFDPLGRLSALCSSLTVSAMGTATPYDLVERANASYSASSASPQWTWRRTRRDSGSTDRDGSQFAYFDGLGRSSSAYAWSSQHGNWATAYMVYGPTGGIDRVWVDDPRPSGLGSLVDRAIASRDAWGRPSSTTEQGSTTIAGTVEIVDRRVGTPGAVAGVRTTLRDPRNGLESDVETDSFGRAVLQRSFGGAGRSSPFVTRYAYDLADRVTRIDHPDGSVTIYTYDLAGQTRAVERFYNGDLVNTMTTADRRETQYDGSGAIRSNTDNRGNTTIVERDPAGRVKHISVLAPGNVLLPDEERTIVYGDDNFAPPLALGRVWYTATPTEQVQFEYDAAGRVTREAHEVNASFTSQGATTLLADAYAFQFGYNLADEVTSVVYAIDGNPSPERLEYRYDSRGHIDRVMDYSRPASGTGLNPRELSSWTHNLSGMVASRTDGTLGAGFGAATRFWTYDAQGRTQSVIANDPAVPAGVRPWSQSITYLGDLPRTLATDPGDVPALPTWTITHDSAGRLTGVTSSGYSLTATYDPAMPVRLQAISEQNVGGVAGTRAHEFRFAAAPAVPPPDGGAPDPSEPSLCTRVVSGAADQYRYQHDVAGAMTRREDVARGESLALEYDAQDHVRVITHDDGRRDQYLYDFAGRRTHVFNATTRQVTSTIAGLLDIAYDHGANAYSGTRLSSSRLAGAAEGIAARVRRDRGVAATSASLVHHDAVGNVALVRTYAGGAGFEYARFEYTPYGESLIAPRGTSDTERRRFHGGEIDPAGSSLVLFGARTYDPATRRWTTRDPIYPSGSARSPYEYALESPLVFRDITGLDAGLVDRGEPDFRDAGAIAGYGGHNFDAGMPPVPTSPAAGPVPNSPIDNVADGLAQTGELVTDILGYCPLPACAAASFGIRTTHWGLGVNWYGAPSSADERMWNGIHAAFAGVGVLRAGAEAGVDLIRAAIPRRPLRPSIPARNAAAGTNPSSAYPRSTIQVITAQGRAPCGECSREMAEVLSGHPATTLLPGEAVVYWTSVVRSPRWVHGTRAMLTRSLQQSGPGSHAIVNGYWTNGWNGTHFVNALNWNGSIWFTDAQYIIEPLGWVERQIPNLRVTGFIIIPGF